MHFDSSQHNEKSLGAILAEIVQITGQVMEDWKDGACAPQKAAELLRKSRLDRLVALSRPLKLWADITPAPEDNDGLLILAWANLGSLVEGWMKFILCVWEHAYAESVEKQKAESIFKKLWDDDRAEAKEADGLGFELLRQFYRAEVRKGLPDAEKWDKWLIHIQERRNAIHVFSRAAAPRISASTADRRRRSEVTRESRSLRSVELKRRVGVIRGRVTDASTATPIQQFRVRIGFSQDARPEDARGSYRSEAGDPGLTFQAPGGEFTINELTSRMPFKVIVEAEGYEQLACQRQRSRSGRNHVEVESRGCSGHGGLRGYSCSGTTPRTAGQGRPHVHSGGLHDS